MNQTEATEILSRTIDEGLHYGGGEGSVTIGHPVDHDGPDLLLVAYPHGLVLSVTVEILSS